MVEYDIRYGKNSNGVRRLEIPIPHRDTASCFVFVKTGSRNETGRGESGISHALEHKIYLGSEKRSGSEWSLASDRLGLDGSAYTEKEFTSYYINLESDTLPKGMELLGEILTRPSFPRNLMETESRVIVGEIADYTDDYLSTSVELFEGLLYSKTNMAKPILGTKSSVLNHSRKQIIDYMNKWYKGGNVLVVVAGRIGKAGPLTEKYFNKFPEGPVAGYEGTAAYGKPGTKVNTQDTNQAHFVLGVPGVSVGDDSYLAMKLIEIILGGHEVLDDRTIQTSRIYDQIRTKQGKAYDVSTFSFAGSDTGYLAIQGSAQPRNFKSTLQIVQDEMFGLASDVTREEVARAKKFMRHYLKTQLESPRKTAELLGIPALLLDRVENPRDIFQKIDGITLDEVRTLAGRLLVPQEMRLVVLGPFDQDLKRTKNDD